jgi:hypothetical protein
MAGSPRAIPAEGFQMIRSRMLGVFFAMAALVSLAIGAAAQQDMPMDGAAHPAHIHAGTCAELDPNPAYPLNDVTRVEDSDVATSTISLDVTLDELLASPFAINAHASAEDIATYIACGDITGPVVDGVLLVPMRAQNDSGIGGIAVLSTNDVGGTDVTIYLSYPETSDM